MKIESGIVAVIHRCSDEQNVGTLVRVYEKRASGLADDPRQTGWWHIVPLGPFIARDRNLPSHFVWLDQVQVWAHEDDMVPLRDLNGSVMTHERQDGPEGLRSQPAEILH